MLKWTLDFFSTGSVPSEQFRKCLMREHAMIAHGQKADCASHLPLCLLKSSEEPCLSSNWVSCWCFLIATNRIFVRESRPGPEQLSDIFYIVDGGLCFDKIKSNLSLIDKSQHGRQRGSSQEKLNSYSDLTQFSGEPVRQWAGRTSSNNFFPPFFFLVLF